MFSEWLVFAGGCGDVNRSQYFLVTEFSVLECDTSNLVVLLAGFMWTVEDNLCDLDFADDIALIADSWSSVQQITTDLITEASKVGLCTNPEKCKVMITNAWNERSDIGCRFRHRKG